MSELLEKAVKDLNEQDANGVVKKVQALMKLVGTNDRELEKLRKHNSELKREINKLVSRGPLTAGQFAVSEEA